MRWIRLFRERKLALFGLTVGILLLAVGAVRGETAMVLSKAARICLECIGIS